MTPKAVTFDILRQTAELKLMKNSSPLNNGKINNMKEILHELSVHQIELELQNESLKRTQIELENSKEDYRELYDFAPVGYFTISESGFIRKANLTGAMMLDMERPCLIDRAFVEFINPDYVDIFHKNARRALIKGGKTSCELKILKNDRTEFFGRLDCVALHDNKSYNCQNIIASLSDISKEKAAEVKITKINEELENKVKKRTIELKKALIAQQESKAELESIYLTAPTAIGLTHNMKIKSVNKKMCDMLGFSKKELLRMDMRSLYANDEDFENIHVKHNATDNFHIGEAEWLCKNGEKIDVLVCESVTFKGNTLNKATFTAMDITNRKKMEIEKKIYEDHLQQTEKMRAIGRLAGGIAHDFNNQLCGIRGYTELLKDEVIDHPLCLKYLNIILKAVERTTNLTKQLLAYARKGKYIKKPIDVHDLIQEVNSLLSININKKIRVSVKQNASQSQTIGDPNQLQNIILNIALNSCDAMQQGGNLSFRTENVFLDRKWCMTGQNEVEPGFYIKISIIDTGTGMDEETQKHVFEPFFTTKEVGKGTGMGLAAAYGTIKNHEGAIQVKSRVGRGTKMDIFLPQKQHDKNHDRQIQNTITHIMKSSGTILIVDDEEIVSSVTGRYFEKKGFKVDVCYNGVQAVEFFKKHWKEIDLVILDMIMPIMDGQETFDELVRINPDVKVILSSGYSLPDKTQDLLKIGVLGFASKPYKMEELHKQIAGMLNKE
jgi:PAS domain S-box-containing protein